MADIILLDIEIPIKTDHVRLEKVPCPICKKHIENFVGKILVNNVSWHIDYCHDDDVWWVNPRPTSEYYKMLYETLFYNSPIPEQFGYASLEIDSNRRIEKAIKNFDDIESHINDIRKESFLEIGCATGALLTIAKKRGFNKVLGVEIEKRCCELAKSQGLEVVCASFEDVKFFDETFDLIFSDNVIEHLLDPEKAVLKCREIQEKGAYIVFRLPETTSNGPRLKLIDHTYHFTRRSITKLLEQCNYKVVDVIYSGTFYSSYGNDSIDNMTVIAKRL